MSTILKFGDLRTGRITDTLDATGCSWAQVGNDGGAIDQVVVERHEVGEKQLRRSARAARSFLAVDVDGRLQEAGPIWSRSWDDEKGKLTLGAGGLWSLFDHRKVLQVLAAGQQVRSGADLGSTTLTGADYGELARALVALAMTHVGGGLPLVLPAARPGAAHTETWPGWTLAKLGQELRQFTTRESGAPDIRFQPRYTADKLSVEWEMATGTEAAPLLTQAGDDWYFDMTARKSPVRYVSTDEDATVMGSRGWITGNGSEEDTIFGTAYDPTLVNDGYPLLELDETRSSVTEQATADGHAANLVARSSRPVEVWKVVVDAAAAADVLAGHYARVVVPKNHVWLPAGETRMRVKSKHGDLRDQVTLNMYPLQAAL